jgi:hypothetical protein
MQNACAVSYCHLYDIFYVWSHKRHDFRKKKTLWNIKYVLIFFTAFVWNISNPKNNSAKWTNKNIRCVTTQKREGLRLIYPWIISLYWQDGKILSPRFRNGLDYDQCLRLLMRSMRHHTINDVKNMILLHSLHPSHAVQCVLSEQFCNWNASWSCARSMECHS